MQTHGATSHGRESGCNSTVVLCAACRHGTVNAYKNHGCRCPLAVRAWSRYMKDYRLRRLRGVKNLIDATGTRRRIHALHALGWTSADIGNRLGCTATAVCLLEKRNRVHRATAKKVCEIYNQLADARGPSSYTTTFARNRGWLPPIWWDDDLIDDPNYDPQQRLVPEENVAYPWQMHPSIDPIAVDRFVHGDTTIPLNRAEKRCAYTEMLSRGVSRNEVVRRLRISWTTAREFAEVDDPQISVRGSFHAGRVSEAAS